MGTATDVARRWSDAPRGIATQWAGVLAGPMAWALDLVVSYALVPWTCGARAQVVLGIMTLFALAMIGAGAYAAWQSARVTSRGTGEGASLAEQRGRFMAVLGLMMCALFGVAVIASAVPRWVLDACES